ncbi:hypothetical protein [Flavitalea flava]
MGQLISKFSSFLLREKEGVTYEQAIQGLFTAGTSVFPDPHKADKERLKEKVGCKRRIENVDRFCNTNTVSLRVVLIPDGINFKINERSYW